MSNKIKTVEIRFENNDKPYTFKTILSILKQDDYVVVETIRGLELGKVASMAKTMSAKDKLSDFKPVIRKASKKDINRYHMNKDQSKEDRVLVEKAIKDEKLPMDVIGCEYTLDQSKLIITYISEKRVDFRNLLKVLTSIFPCRIELKQIGPREKAKIVGGIGVCGRSLCCSETRGDFDMITISMAKNQLLSLNISKLSGQCGKLKCCLKFENDYYTDAKQGLPQQNTSVEYEGNMYRVADFNVVSQTLTLAKKEEVRVITFQDYRDYETRMKS